VIKRKNLFFIISAVFISNLIYSYGGSVPAGLPSTFGFGAIDKADQYAQYGPHFWKDNQGTTCWDYSYQYLTPGWVNWVSGGGWAKQELQYWEGKGQIQIFTWYYYPYNTSWYQNGSNMTNYFNDFKLLMQIINQYSTKKVIVHIEPDLLGFWKQSGKTPTQTGVVAVGSSNFDEVCDGVSINSLPDSIQGWSEALYRIRNQYAKNKCLLAHHYTHWATGADIFTGSQDQATVNSHVDTMTTFITQIENGKSFDLFFVDPSDRDADWYYIKQGTSNRWTSSEHTFTNYRSWGKIGYIVDRVSTNLSRRGMMWQIPVGNTYFKTCNNSDNHYRDNHAQEFLPSSSNNGASGTPGDAYSQSDTTKGPGFWANKGIIAVLFGEGGYDGYVNPNDMTHLRDWPNDGITNPSTNKDGAPGYNTWGQATSNYSDNDGGYIRLAVAAYCSKGKFPLPGAGGTATATGTNTPQPTATFTSTRTNTITNTSTATFTNTIVPTNTNTPTSTASNTRTSTSTSTVTNTATNTTAITNTFTATPTNTKTITPTYTSTFTNTVTTTNTGTNTPTMTNTHTNTRTPTSTNTVYLTSTATNTSVFKNTATSTATATNTITLTQISTPTYTRTQQPTINPTSTNTNLPDISLTPTFTFTFIQTFTPTMTYTQIHIFTNTQTPTSTLTFTATSYSTFTQTFTITSTNTPVIMPTNTPVIIGEEDIIKFIDIPRIYPNPADGKSDLFIKFKTTKKPYKITFRLYTSSFRFIYEFTKENITNNELTLRNEVISRFARGTYYYILIVQDELGKKAKSEVSRIIILK